MGVLFLIFRRNVMMALIVVGGFLGQSQIGAQDHPLWGGLKSGQFEVGFKTIETYDYSRSVNPAVDYKGEASTTETAWPMQVSIWYPAKPSATESKMLFAEYGYLMSSPVQFDEIGERTNELGLNRLKDFINLIVRRTRQLTSQPTDEQIDELFTRETASFKNAQPLPGEFPVILVGFNGMHSKQVMCEYLASHGFVVISCTEPVDPILRNTYQTVQRETNARNLEFLTKTMRDFPNAGNQLGLILWSSTSIGGLIFQMRNMQAHAVLSIEGHEAYANGVETLQNSPYFDPVKMRVPFMRMEIPNRLSGRWATDYTILDSFKYAERYFLTFHTMEHNDMGSPYSMMLDVLPENKKPGYETLCRYALNFFNAYLKEDKQSLAFMNASPQTHGLKSDFLTLERKSALAAVPTKAEFLQLVLDEKIDEAVGLFAAAKKSNPDIVLFEEWIFNRIGYNFLRAGKANHGVRIFELLVAAYPESANAYDSLAEAYMKSDQPELAIKNYEKSLVLNPENSNATEMLKKLQAGK